MKPKNPEKFTKIHGANFCEFLQKFTSREFLQKFRAKKPRAFLRKFTDDVRANFSHGGFSEGFEHGFITIAGPYVNFHEKVLFAQFTTFRFAA